MPIIDCESRILQKNKALATAIAPMATAMPSLDPTEIKNNKSTHKVRQNALNEKSQLHKTVFRITSHPTLTPFRRRVYRILMSVPSGRWTTYSAISKHLNSGPRAIGNAMKNNPFAPAVPCHRVLATDRSLGGYKGAWVNGGEYSTEKMKLLLDEGVEFDGNGKAMGDCFVDFVDVQ